jgi:7-cyano-7-deazaguanine synthase
MTLLLPSTAVLLSAGLDSAVLAAAEAQTFRVYPIYVSAGLAWEGEERNMVQRLLRTELYRGVAPLTTLEFSVRDLYPAGHWALQGAPPHFDTPDEDVYLVGRNLILLTKAAIYCAQRGIERIALGPLAGNPFPDATAEFFATLARTLSLGLAQPLAIATPFADLHKPDVIRLGADLGVPFALTLSCMNPHSGRHCGRCSKCRERRDAFAAAKVADPTPYNVAPLR